MGRRSYMNGVEKIVMENMIESLKHCQKVFRSLSERGKYPQELVPFDMSGKIIEGDHPLFLGIQGYIFIESSIRAAEELLKNDAEREKEKI
jgi:hypothetical protein